MNRQHDSLCYYVTHWPDTVHHKRQYRYAKDSVSSMSELNDDSKYLIDERRILLTVLFFNASARYCVPSVPILFPVRSNSISVYINDNSENVVDK